MRTSARASPTSAPTPAPTVAPAPTLSPVPTYAPPCSPTPAPSGGVASRRALADDRDTLERDTAASALASNAVEPLEEALLVKPPPRDDYGDVASKDDVACLAALLAAAGSCARHPDRAAAVSVAAMLYRAVPLFLQGSDAVAPAFSMSCARSRDRSTLGLPKPAEDVVDALSLGVPRDAVIVGYRAGARSVAVSGQRHGAVDHLDRVFEPASEGGDDSTTLGELCGLPEPPDALTLYVYCPSGSLSKSTYNANDAVHVYVPPAAAAAEAERPAERVFREALAIQEGDVSLEATDLAVGAAPTNPIESANIQPKKTVEQPLTLGDLRRLQRAAPEDPLAAILARAERRRRPDRLGSRARERFFAGSPARDPSNAPAAAAADDAVDVASLRATLAGLRARCDAIIAQQSDLLVQKQRLADALSQDVQQKLSYLRSQTDAIARRKERVKELERDIAKLGRELSKVRAERHKVEAAILAADAAPPADREYDDDIEWEEDDEEDDAQVEADDFIFSDDDDSVGDFDSAGSTDSDADDSDIPDDA